MKIDEAIKIAAENGYYDEFSFVSDNFIVDHATENIVTFYNKYSKSKRNRYTHRILMNPLFWQALGNGLEWMTSGTFRVETVKPIYIPSPEILNEHKTVIYCDEWLYRWHQLINHLADGGTIDEYFENINK